MIPKTHVSGVPCVPLSELKFGHELREDNINARIHGRDNIKSLTHSIKTAGLIVPLTYERRENGQRFVVDGNRRLAALRAIIPEKEWPTFKTPAVEVADGRGLELSMIANVERLDLHPVERHRVFSTLAANGASVAEIASKFMVKKRQVEQALALGRLHSTILDAWLEDEIDAESAEAFTIEADKDRQAKVFKKLGSHCSEYSVRSALVGDQHQAERLLKTVGLEAYRAAGGATVTDLFSEKDVDVVMATDIPLLEKLAQKKIEETFVRLTKEGWKWVVVVQSTSDRTWYWDSKPKAEVKDKSKYGALIGIGYDGDLQIKYGVTKPSDAKAKEKKKAMAKGEAPPVSNALATRLSETLTKATADALVKEPSTAIAALLAGFKAAGVVKVESSGMENQGAFDGVPFDTAFKKFAAMSSKEHCVELAKVAAAALDLRVYNAEHPPLKDKEVAALCNYLDPRDMNEALRKRFNYEDYFESVSADTCYLALKEAFPRNSDFQRKQPKAGVVKICLATLPKAKWLPAELRVKGYDGPK